MHRLFSERRPLSASAEFDFGEAPSQIMEQWLDDPATLVRWARHFRTGEPLPMEIAQAFARASQSGRALGMRGQIAQSQLFLDLFDGPPRAGDLQEIELRSWPIRVYPPLDWYHAWAGMRHIASYSSNLYTYAWSQALLRDLLAGFDQGDLLSPERGRRYRKLVLEATGTMPASTAVERFLGRPTGMRAFRDWLGEEPEPGK
jgi:Zn-dependent oligopeptidase